MIPDWSSSPRPTSCSPTLSSADATPQPDATEMVGGNEVKLGPSHHQNRLNSVVRRSSASKGRIDRLRPTLADLYNRVSTGVHADVTNTEARYLFLATHTYLG